MHDIIIKNGTIIDGSGEPMYQADLAINNQKITKIGDLSQDNAKEIIDAKNLYISPGFIDISNRSDMSWQIFIDPTLEGLLHQGITTIIGGNVGSSLAPIYNKDMLLSAQKWIDVQKVNVNWQSMKNFLDVVESYNLSVNFGTLVGHSTLRRGLIGDDYRDLSKTEMKSLKKHIKESLKQGALGLSSGLAYVHGRSISEEELVEVGKLVKKYNGLHIVNTRYERDNFVKAVEEIIQIASQSGVRTHISHLKVIDKKNWAKMAEALEMIDIVNERGLNLSFDFYPYTHTGSVLYMFLPIWATEGGKKVMLSRLKNKEIYERIAKEMDKQGIDLSSARVFNKSYGSEFRNKTLGDLAKSHGKSVSKVVLDILLAYEGRAMILFESLSEENIIRKMQDKNSIITSNGSAYSKDKQESSHVIHPRSFGAFPRALGLYTRKKEVMSWEQVIHKSTGKVAEQLNLEKRGLIKENYFADINIFNLENIIDKATVENPMIYAKGIKHVIINGCMVVQDEKFIGTRSGQVLRRS
ncbi:MAG: amidohydrolase family protein [Candidatus Moranbacteria bacterium]|nr:amidohydrolase family protein [Candidatus Moranbacteria bacterium]